MRLRSLASRRTVVAGLALAVAGALWIRVGPIAPELLDVSDATSVLVVDRHGVPLYEARSADGTRNVRLEAERLPPVLAAATVAAEDRRFYSHPGVDVIAIVRALRRNVAARAVVEGGSTITQQTAKLLLTRRAPHTETRSWEPDARAPRTSVRTRPC